ncbi:MAG: NAD(+) synthase [Crocinitomicaceae bacterium]|nr:NAD(+) synthase [Crocinitomicaceae bacterium]
MKTKKITKYIINWLNNYCKKNNLSGFIVGISGGIDSALTSTLCAMTNKKVILVSMPIRQNKTEYKRAIKHIDTLEKHHKNVSSYDIDLSNAFLEIEKVMPFDISKNNLAMANSRSRLRMTTLYSLAQANNCLVVGTGNKVEDFGIGFFTKYGDGGVDISPIADLNKTTVWEIAKELNIIEEIILASPTDGLWDDNRTDEEQIGASYKELEWAMEYKDDETNINKREKEVLKIYKKLNKMNEHKIKPIPICIIPEKLKK